MSLVNSMLKVPKPAASPAASWPSAGRIAAAVTLVLAAAFPLASHLIPPPIADRSTYDWLHWVADRPDLANLTKVFELLALPFLFGTVLVYVLLSRQRSPRLAYAGGILFGCGLVGLSAVEGYETLAYALAQDGRFDLAALADVSDQSSTPAIVMLLIFLPFAFFGLLTSAVALWRSGAVPRAAVLLIVAFLVVDVFLGPEGFGITPDWVSRVISFVGACWIASAVLLAGRAGSSGEAIRQKPR
jgi:hypothetical protein